MADEIAYERGSRAAWTAILKQAKRELGYDQEPVRTVESFIAEREATIAALRDLCETYGDNDWPDDANLADVVDKHLGRYLDEMPDCPGDLSK